MGEVGVGQTRLDEEQGTNMVSRNSTSNSTLDDIQGHNSMEKRQLCQATRFCEYAFQIVYQVCPEKSNVLTSIHDSNVQPN